MLESHKILIERDIVNALQRVKSLEQLRRFDEVFAELSFCWSGTNEYPQIQDYSKTIQAEILLRCGVALGWKSNFKQYKEWNLIARNWITQSHRINKGLGLTEKAFECELEIVLNYWREGDTSNAEAWLFSAKSQSNSICSELKIRITSICLVIYIEQKNYSLAKEIIQDSLVFIESSENSAIKIPFFLNCGRVFHETADFTNAINCYLKVAELSEQLGNTIDRGIAENNIGNLYAELNSYDLALEYSLLATARFESVRDFGRQAACLDSRAEILLKQGDLVEALICIDKSIEILETGDEFATLANSMWTKTVILLKLNQRIDAYRLFNRLISLAENNISEAAALTYVSKFDDLVYPIQDLPFDIEVKDFQYKILSQSIGKHKKNLHKVAREIGLTHSRLRNILKKDHPDLNSTIPEKTGKSKKVSSTTYTFEDLPLNLPKSINPTCVFRNHGERFKYLGLFPGTIAICVASDYKSENPIVVRDAYSGEISCGIPDLDELSGILGLLSLQSEPILIEAEKVQILGKIVGYCVLNDDEDGYDYFELKFL